MKIVSFKICPFVQRVIGALEVKQLSYEVEYISLMDKPDWFLKASPHGQVPILIEPAGNPDRSRNMLTRPTAIFVYIRRIPF
jgi:glutathione S-transferase